MTKWIYRRCPNDGLFYGWDDADPAADPEVQARILRAVANELEKQWLSSTMDANVPVMLRRFTDALVDGHVTLQVEEERT